MWSSGAAASLPTTSRHALRPLLVRRWLPRWPSAAGASVSVSLGVLSTREGSAQAGSSGPTPTSLPPSPTSQHWHVEACDRSELSLPAGIPRGASLQR